MSNTYYVRDMMHGIKRAMSIFPVVVISGARQTGKTTMLQNEEIFKQRKYYTLDDLDVLATAKKEPEAILESAPQITIDEVQRSPEIFLSIKRIVDKKRTPGQFLLSGSANLIILKNLSETLSVRACYLNLLPFSLREINRKVSNQPFFLVCLM